MTDVTPERLAEIGEAKLTGLEDDITRIIEGHHAFDAPDGLTYHRAAQYIAASIVQRYGSPDLAATIERLQAEVARLTVAHDEWREACLGHGEKANKAEADLTTANARVKDLEGDFEFIARWCHREGISTDGERMSVIRNYSPIAALKGAKP